MDASAEIFEEHRAELLRLAYHMLGRFSDAEDMVQDAYIRWQQVDTNTVNNASAYLSTIVTRLCLDELKSARNRREQYIGPDLPDLEEKFQSAWTLQIRNSRIIEVFSVLNPDKLQHLRK